VHRIKLIKNDDNRLEGMTIFDINESVMMHVGRKSKDPKNNVEIFKQANE
jgi:hypothetical protein